MTMKLKSSAALITTALLAGCGGGGGGNPSPFLGDIAVPGIGATTAFSFDLGLVTNHGGVGRYYVTDRNNMAVDVVDTQTLQFITQITGTGANVFAGCRLTGGASMPTCVGINNDLSGPDGIDEIYYTNGSGALVNKLYAGDINSIKVIDPVALTVTKTITNLGIIGSKTRADEGCFNLKDHLYWSSSTADTTANIINTDTDAVVAKITFNEANGTAGGGLEACVYDAKNDMWFVNNDGMVANPDGEINGIPGAAMRALVATATNTTYPTVNYLTIAGVKIYSQSSAGSPCDGTGLALGPGNDMAINCRPAAVGAPLVVKILDRTTGVFKASVPAGGGDQLAYDATSNRYYSASNHWNKTGKTIVAGGGCTAALPCNPVLAVIDATSYAVLNMLPTGNNAHSVAVDPVTGRVFLPHSSDTGGAGFAKDPQFVGGIGGAGGISVYQGR